MLVFNTVKSLKTHLALIRKEGKSIGFSPTMGALHEGHASLIKEAKANKDYSVCSIFVNPTQFNQASDLTNYPRTLATDTDFLASIGNDLLFAPSVSSIYPARLKKKPRLRFRTSNTSTRRRLPPRTFYRCDTSDGQAITLNRTR